MMSPPVCIANIGISAMKPIRAPITISRANAAKSSQSESSVVPTSTPEELNTGITAIARPRKSSTLILVAITGEPSTGAKSASPPRRATTSSKGNHGGPEPADSGSHGRGLFHV